MVRLIKSKIDISRHHYTLYGEELVCDLTYRNYYLLGIKIWQKRISEDLLGTFDEVYPEYAVKIGSAPNMSNAQLKRQRLQNDN